MNVLSIPRNATRLALSRYYLRAATVGARPRVWGRPRIVNRGTLTIGNNCMVRSICVRTELVANDDAWLSIGNRCYIHDGTSIAAYYQVSIGDRVLMGRDCLITDNDQHRIEPERRQELPESEAVVIENDVWLGDRVTVLKGVRIGRGSVVAAGSVVTKDVEPYTVVAGVPARPIRTLDATGVAKEVVKT